MKKLMILAVSATLALGATSCKKDYTCSCTVAGVTANTPITKSTKSDATSACDKLNTAAKAVGGSCSLK